MKLTFLAPLAVCASLWLPACDGSAGAKGLRGQQIVHYEVAVVEAGESPSGKRELRFGLRATGPDAEVELRFDFPEPKRILAYHSTQAETVLVVGEDGARYCLDHRQLLDQTDRHQNAGLVTLDRFREKGGRESGD